jgi:hypothetical protein
VDRQIALLMERRIASQSHGQLEDIILTGHLEDSPRHNHFLNLFDVIY